MIIFDLARDDENNPIYQDMAAENLARQYSFMQSLVDNSLALRRPLLSHEIIKALNFHAIACLHSSAVLELALCVADLLDHALAHAQQRRDA